MLITRITHEMGSFLLPSSIYATKLKKKREKPTVYLTFDDGPHPEYTPKILDELNKIGAKATFFVIGKNLQGNEELLRRVLSEGHSLAVHGWDHLKVTNVSMNEYVNDTMQCKKDLEAIIGKECRLFRPPYGELTVPTLASLASKKLQIIHWSLDTKDYKMKDGEELINWYQNKTLTDGDVILMHEMENTAMSLSEALSPFKGLIHFDAIEM